TRWGLRYEAFLAEMSSSSRIAFRGGFTAGQPGLAGLHLSIEPARGWSIGVNRLLQYGGGARGGQSIGDLLRAFFRPGRFDNIQSPLLDEQFGNQLASITSSFIFPGKQPLVVNLEYAGEDTSRGRSTLLGNSALAIGLRWPNLAARFDAGFEFTEWQNGWYVNALYGDGLRHRGRVLGHWGGEARLLGDAVGAQALSAHLGWADRHGADWMLRYRTLQNESYGAFAYRRAHELGLHYDRPLHDALRGGLAFEIGRDVFGESYSRLAGVLRYASGRPNGRARSIAAGAGSARRPAVAERYIEYGVSANRLTVDLDDTTGRFARKEWSPQLGVGLRRAVSARQDLGVRLEWASLDGRSLIAVRAVDYRFRSHPAFALNVFAGAARYDLATPAYGLWAGAGASWLDIRPGWNLGFELRAGIKIARDDLVSGDPFGGRPDSFYDIESASLSLSRRF
ncbi:MAG: capsule assembly Wzi family protein, partial [Steroidobacteraceae bacterium]|nr:capsule assembly Wzi family protein [Steroidobacteraceae bacterium]MDW8259779.1 capsule assembly Wzi family protein [Gammaproteobacteria bacterium]